MTQSNQKHNRQGRFKRNVNRVMTWRQRYVTDQVYHFLVASGVGLVTGVCAFLLKWMIGWVNKLTTLNLDPSTFNYRFLWIPLAGIILTGLFQRYIIHRQIFNGVQRLVTDLDKRQYDIPPVMMWAYMVASTLTLGFGGSAGSEGPIASTGAAIGGNVARYLKLSPRMLRIMIGCGAGAGIAGIFKAPIGGVLFTLEVLKLEMTTVSVMNLIVACLISSMTAYVLSGCTVDLSYLQITPFDPGIVVYIILLGVVCGFYSLYYTFIMEHLGKLLKSINIPIIRNIAGGLLLSIILFFFPAMYGEGYGMMSHLLNGEIYAINVGSGIFHNLFSPWVLVAICGAIAIVKAFATSATNNSGGVAGDFAPTLFAGCFVGFCFAQAINTAFGLDLPVAAMAFMGMAGVMSGTIRAPLMAIFLTAEMTNGFMLLLPLIGVSAISFGIVRLFRGTDYYHDPWVRPKT